MADVPDWNLTWCPHGQNASPIIIACLVLQTNSPLPTSQYLRLPPHAQCQHTCPPPCAAAIAEITPPSIHNYENTPAPQTSSSSPLHVVWRSDPSTPLHDLSSATASRPARPPDRSDTQSRVSSWATLTLPLVTQTAAYYPAPAIIRSKPSTSFPRRPIPFCLRSVRLTSPDRGCRWSRAISSADGGPGEEESHSSRSSQGSKRKSPHLPTKHPGHSSQGALSTPPRAL